MKISSLFNVYFTAVVILFSMACEKEYKGGTPVNRPSSESLGNFFEDNVASATQTFTFDASFQNFIQCNKGALVSVPAGAFEDNLGNVITGVVDIEIIEIYDRADMLLLNKSTNAMRNGERGVLISGGQFYMNATYQGEQVVLVKSIEIDIPTSNTGGNDNDMGLWRGEIQGNGDMLWTESSLALKIKDSIINPDTSGSDTTWNDTTNYIHRYSYNFHNDGFGWVNCDKWYNDPRQKTEVKVYVSEGYDDKNTAVYYTYVNEPNLMGSFYGFQTQAFTGGTYPIGVEMHFIVVSSIDNGLFYSIHTETITSNHIVNVDDMQLTTEENLRNAVNALP